MIQYFKLINLFIYLIKIIRKNISIIYREGGKIEIY